MSPSRRTTLHALLPLLVAAAPLSAQQVAGTLTLDEAVQLAHEHNPAFQRVRNDIGVASSAVRAAWASAYLPSLSSSMSFGGSRRTTQTGEDPFGEVVRLPQSRTSHSSDARQGVSSQLTLFDGFRGIRAWRAQREQYDGTEAQIESQAVQLSAQVAREYYQAVKAVRTIALEEALLESARERLLRTEELLRLAARNRVDVLGAREDVAQAEQNLERARGDADKARLALAATIGLEPSASLSLDSVLPQIFDPAELDPALLVSRALSGSPLVHQRESAVRAARHRAAAARGRRLPSLTANASYSRSINQEGYGAFTEFNPLNYGFTFGLSVSLPLFTRFETSSAIGEADAAVQDAEHDLRGVRLTVERDVRGALIDLENAYRSLILAEQKAEFSRERQQLTQEQYRLGGINFTDLQNVIDRTAAAERQALDARFQFIAARVNLEEKLGARLGG